MSVRPTRIKITEAEHSERCQRLREQVKAEQLTGVPYDPNHMKLYLCGSDAMIKQVIDYAVRERGFDRKDIVHEKFFD